MDAEYQTRECPRAVLNWDDFLYDRRGALERISKQLDLSWPRWNDDALAEIDTFVTTDLRHQSISEEELRLHPAVSDVVRDAYAAFADLIEDPVSRRAQARLDDIRARFDDASAIFDSALFEAKEEARRLRSEALAEREDLASRLEAAQHAFVGAAAEREGLRGELALARDELAALAAAGDRLSAQFAAESDARAALENRLHEADGRLRRAEESLAYFADRYARLHRAAVGGRVRGQKGSKYRSTELQAIRGSAYFDADYYLEKNEDVRSKGLDPSIHYLLYGAEEGRDPGPLFSTRRYLQRFPDVAAAGVNPLAHYELFGRAEKRTLVAPQADGSD